MRPREREEEGEGEVGLEPLEPLCGGATEAHCCGKPCPQ